MPIDPPPPRREKATLRDVANAVGVSVATVSRALSRPEMVSPALRERIDATCRALHYIANHAARSLTLDRSRALGLVVPTISNPVFSPLIESLQARLEQRGYGLLIHCCHRDPRRERQQSQMLIERGVDGIILGNPVHDPALLETLERFGVPYLCVAGSARGLERPAITYDAGRAMCLALDHLVTRGHRAIAVLSGPGETTPVIADRLAAARLGLRRHGLDVPPAWDIACGYDAADARAGAARLLDASDLPTAVLCTGDLHALAVIAVCGERGLRVPRDMSVTGCNDMAVAQFSNPALTTVRTPYAEMGGRAADVMLAMIAGAPVPPLTLLPSVLTERGSVAPPRGAERLIYA